jgi:hypothetical protein
LLFCRQDISQSHKQTLNITFSLQPPDMDLTPSDPRWVGAWWLGYLCGGILLLLTSLLILAYPREMPGTKEIRARAIRDGKFFALT